MEPLNQAQAQAQAPTHLVKFHLSQTAFLYFAELYVTPVLSREIPPSRLLASPYAPRQNQLGRRWLRTRVNIPWWKYLPPQLIISDKRPTYLKEIEHRYADWYRFVLTPDTVTKRRFQVRLNDSEIQDLVALALLHEVYTKSFSQLIGTFLEAIANGHLQVTPRDLRV